MINMERRSYIKKIIGLLMNEAKIEEHRLQTREEKKLFWSILSQKIKCIRRS